MRSIALLAAATALMAGSGAFAQTPAPNAPANQDNRPGRFDQVDYEALVDARLAAIEAGLRLTEEQRKLWPALEQAYRAHALARIDRRDRRGPDGRDQDERPDFPQRLEQRAERVTGQALRLTALSNAIRPFWASLDERQKRLLPVLMRPSFRLTDGRGGHRGMRHHGGGHGGHHGGHHGGPGRS